MTSALTLDSASRPAIRPDRRGIRSGNPEARSQGAKHAVCTALLILGLALGVCTPSLAYTIVVDQGGSGDFVTIAEGLDAASSGDVVLVLPGKYAGPGNRELSFGSKEITLKSAAGAEDTIIDLEGHAGISIVGSDNRFRVLRGFTITHGGGSDDPALLCESAWAHIDSCIFSENSIGVSGEAVEISDCTFVTVSACRFVGNKRAISSGSAWEASTLVSNCVFVENGTGPSAPGRGAIWLSMAGNGATIQSCTFEGNETTGNGAAIFYVGGRASIVDCHFSDNRSGQTGGAIYAHAYLATVSGHPKIWDCTFTDNHADSRGGAIARIGASPDIRRCVFTGNTATWGGAVFIDYDHEDLYAARIQDSSFFENEAERGGAVFLSDTNSHIERCGFFGNRAIMWGGGVCWTDSPDFTPRISECTFVRNASHRGGGVFSDYAPTIVAYSTFFGNESDDGAVAVLRDHHPREPEILNCVIAFSSSGTSLYCQLSDPDVHHCVFFGNAAGDDPCGDHHDNLIADPLFCDVYEDDFTLCANSPCLAENNPWAVAIGAHGLGCAECDSPVAPMSWTGIKALYRDR